MNIKLKDYISIEGQIRLISGLHIGSGTDEIHIGGIDNPVIRNTLNGEPYIPGSSLKGKMRSLIELATGKIGKYGGPFSVEKNTDVICELFGNGIKEKDYTGGITRLLFNDCELENNIKQIMIKRNSLTESKTEVSIDRITGTASKAGPRQVERVPAGAKFNFSISIRIMNNDNKEIYLDYIKLGMKLLEYDALGGSGSRGYGRIKFEGMRSSSMTEDSAPFSLAEFLKNLVEKVSAKENNALGK